MLTGTIPSELGRLDQLTELSIFLNNMTGSIPDELYDCTSLVHFNLQANSLTGTISRRVGQLRKLKECKYMLMAYIYILFEAKPWS